MREIKFRIFGKENQIMYEWEEILNFDSLKDSLKNGSTEDNYYSPLMQYTGLLDKNGKEIYEGDILQYDSPSPKYQYKHQVIFDDGRYRFSGMDSFVFNKMNLNYKRGYKVIGNIYENPELLEEGK